MRIAYLDCVGGISGNMLLGALCELGLERAFFVELAARLQLANRVEIILQKVRKMGLAATYLDIKMLGSSEMGRDMTLPAIAAHLAGCDIDDDLRRQAIEVFELLTEAEAKAHGISQEKAHLHEVGDPDALVDIVGALAGLRELGIKKVMASPLPLGSGTIHCRHGRLPLPAPATLNLIQGLETRQADFEGETVTPTGAALVKYLAAQTGPLPPMKVERVGIGAGKADFPIPNILRIVLGTLKEKEEARGLIFDTNLLVETNIDDMNPQLFEPLMENLFEAGVLDVYLTPIVMKKGRPAQKISLLISPDLLDTARTILLKETTSLGIRVSPVKKYMLQRKMGKLETPWGPVRIKKAYMDGVLLRTALEYDDLKRLAESEGIPVLELEERLREMLPAADH